MEAYELEHIAKVRAVSPECMVLLKSDGSFPLEAPGKIALYGNTARKTIKGGTGSGDVNVRHYPSIEEGLENAGFTRWFRQLRQYPCVRLRKPEKHLLHIVRII